MSSISAPAAPPRAARHMTRFVRTADRWLFAPGSAHALAVARTVLAALFAVRIAFGPYRGLVEQPEVLFRPPPFLSFLDDMPPVWVIAAVQVLGTIAAVAAAARRAPRASFTTAWIALLVLAGLRGSFGKVLHNDVFLLLAAAPFLVAPLGVRIGDPTRSSAYGFARRAALVVVASAYGFAGLQKLRHSGLEWVTSDNFRWIMDGAARTERSLWPDLARLIADTPWLATASAAGLVAFELGFATCLIVPRLRVAAFAGAAALHLGTVVLLGLDYASWIVVDAVVLLDLDRLRVPGLRPIGSAPALRPRTPGWVRRGDFGLPTPRS